MSTQLFSITTRCAPPGHLSGPLYLGPNDGGIHRGDREDTGDNEARPDELGHGPAEPTVDPTSLGGITSTGHSDSQHFDIDAERADYDGLEITTADDGRLGLTNVGNKPPEDWAADTGETRTPESSET